MSDSSNDSDEFFVERILDKQFLPDGTPLYKIRWQGFGSDEDTWEQQENLFCDQILVNFEREYERKQAAKLSAQRREKKPKGKKPRKRRGLTANTKQLSDSDLDYEEEEARTRSSHRPRKQIRENLADLADSDIETYFSTSTDSETPEFRKEESANGWTCNECKLYDDDCSARIKCKICSENYHVLCISSEEDAPEAGSKWKCSHCLPICIICKTNKRAPTIKCVRCSADYHTNCLFPIPKQIKQWHCSDCLKWPDTVYKIITFRVKPEEGTASNDTSSDNDLEYEKGREYYIKWEDKSYRHCEWVSGSWLARVHWQKFSNFCNKHAEPEDISDIIPEAWTTPERVVAAEGNLYLVKWLNLPYDHCTWEPAETVERSILQSFYKREQPKPKKKIRVDFTDEPSFSLYKFKESPKFLQFSLYDYQLEGVNWLLFNWLNQRNSILADEMGLGKTIQTIAFCGAISNLGESKPTLIVVPLSTLHNWAREFATWMPQTNCVTYSGDQNSRKIIRSHEWKASQGSGAKFDVLLTTYEIAMADISVLRHFHYGCLVVDEAHRLKNLKSKLFGCLDSLATSHRILLTGTPLQNNLLELFSIMKILKTDKLEFQSVARFEEEFEGIISAMTPKKQVLIPKKSKREKSKEKVIDLTAQPKTSELDEKVIQDALNGEDSGENLLGNNENSVVISPEASPEQTAEHETIEIDTSQETVDYATDREKSNTSTENRIDVDQSTATEENLKNSENTATAASEKEIDQFLANSPGSGSSPLLSPTTDTNEAKNCTENQKLKTTLSDVPDDMDIDLSDHQKPPVSKETEKSQSTVTETEKNLSTPPTASTATNDASIIKQEEEIVTKERQIDKRKQIKRLHEILAPHFLRRLKRDVLKHLPPKVELAVPCPLSNLQKEFYKATIIKNYGILSPSNPRVVSLRNILSALRNVCNHPYIFPEAEPKDKGEPEEIVMNRLVEASGKLKLMDRLLLRLKEQNHKALIFSQSTMMLDIIEDYIRWRKFNYERIDGSIVNEERQASIDRYNTNQNSFLFLISTRAGRLGLNLAAADTVIIYDSDYNPHNDLQALSRAHRIGQENVVMIYRLFCKNTVEQVCLERAQGKLVLEHIVVGKMEQSFKKGEINEVIKHGARKLFEENSVDEDPQAFDEEQLEKILDRKQCLLDSQQQEASKEHLDGLNTFSLTDVWKVAADEDSSVSQRNFWENLLKDRIKTFEKKERDTLVLGKRRTRNSSHQYAGADVGIDDSEEEEDFVPPEKKVKSSNEIDEDMELLPSDITQLTHKESTPTPPTPTPGPQCRPGTIIGPQTISIGQPWNYSQPKALQPWNAGTSFKTNVNTPGNNFALPKNYVPGYVPRVPMPLGIIPPRSMAPQAGTIMQKSGNTGANVAVTQTNVSNVSSGSNNQKSTHPAVSMTHSVSGSNSPVTPVPAALAPATQPQKVGAGFGVKTKLSSDKLEKLSSLFASPSISTRAATQQTSNKPDLTVHNTPLIPRNDISRIIPRSYGSTQVLEEVRRQCYQNLQSQGPDDYF